MHKRIVTVVTVIVAVALVGCGATPAAAPAEVTIRLTAPDRGAPVLQGLPVEIRGEYTGGEVSEVAVRVNGVEFTVIPAESGGTAVAAPWTPSDLGQHVLYLEARDASRQVLARSEIVPILVTASTPTAMPTVAPAQPPAPTAAPTEVATLPAAIPAAATTAEPAATAAPAATATPIAPSVTVADNDFVNLRSGPGTGYELIGRLNKGQTARVTGKNEAGTWWQVNVDGKTAWVIGDLVQVSSAAAGVAVAAAPPLPTAEPTVPPAPTAVPTPAATEVPPTPAATPTPSCDPSNPFWAATLNNAPDYTFCTPVPFEFIPNADPDPRQMVIRWHIYGDIKSLELRVDPNGSNCGVGSRGLTMQVPFKEDNFRLNKGDFPKGGYKIGLWATMNDGRIQDWGELNFCGEG